MNQGFYSTTYGYDGADQLTSEASTGGSPPPTLGYTYDKNGNRLTQTSNGTQVQSFTYDAHDKLTSGTSGSETDTYDKNGSETSTTIGGVTYRETYDDEDRLTSIAVPNVGTDTFTYNGLGLRVGKTDSTGTYSYLCDGASPGADVLYDGHAVYTAGLSETRAGVSSFYDFDRLGNLWTLDGSSKNQEYYQDTTGFGTNTATGGTDASPFKFGGENGCQTDADTGLVLMGHRYYDTRIGRFITQDPAGDGDNWYAYASNSPTNNIDPTGLSDGLPNGGLVGGLGFVGSPDQHYGGLGGFLDGDPGGLFGGQSNLDSFWASEDAAMTRGQAGYLAAAAAAAEAAHHKRYYHQWLNAPGTVWNNSSYSIPIMFDHDTKKGGKIFYEMTLPPHTYTGLEDIDFVYWANDSQQPGGYDWRHIAGDTNVIIQNSGSGISTSGIFYPGSFKGYPFNVTPIPVSGNTSIEIFSIPQPAIPPLLVGPIP